MKNDLQKLFDEYINECKYSVCLRPETVRGYQEVFKLFTRIMPEIINTDLLTTEAVVKFFEIIKTRERTVGKNTKVKGVKNSTIKTYWTKLNSFFHWLETKDIIVRSPLKNIKRPRVTYTDHRALENSEVDKIYAAIVLKTDDGLRLRRDVVIINILRFCGLRKGELLSLKVKDVDMIKKELTIQGETSKSGKSRILPMHDLLVNSLKEYFKERNKLDYKTEYLIVSSSDDRNLTADGLKHWVKSLIKKSGVKFHLHRFRHSFATNLAKINTGSFNIQKLMGHASLTMTAKYTRSLRPENMRAEIEKL